MHHLSNLHQAELLEKKTKKVNLSHPVKPNEACGMMTVPT